MEFEYSMPIACEPVQVTVVPEVPRVARAARPGLTPTGRNRWTEERIELLKELIAKGCSSTQVAKELACGITRNGVIGKSYRLGLKRPRPSTPSPRQRRAANAPKHVPTPRRRRPRVLNVAGMFSTPEPKPAPVALAEPVAGLSKGARQRTFFELRSDECRWPHGDPGTVRFFFCGADRLGSLPYCIKHARAAYVVPKRMTAGGRAHRLQRVV